MNDAKFSRELKSLIYYVREYGIQHLSFRFDSLDNFPTDQPRIDEFFTQVHNGFFAAQDRVIYLLRKILLEQKRLKVILAEVRRQHKKEQEQEVKASLDKAKYQELVLRKVIDSIAWQIFHYDLSTLRRFYCGQELIDITDSNLDSEVSFVTQYVQDHPDSFVLISDLTSFIQIGDVVTISKEDGVKISELKEGPVNDKIFQIIDEVAGTKCPRHLQLKLEGENKSFIKHFDRTIKQIIKSHEVYETISTGYGTDQLTGQKIRIYQEEIELDTYSEVVNKLSNDCHKRGYSISVIEDCLLIGVYDVGKFPSWVFDAWAKGLRIEMPIYDMRASFYDPLAYPLFLHPFSTAFIADLVVGKKVIKMTIDVTKCLDTLTADGCTVKWMSKKETARANSKLKGSNKIFDINGQGVEVEKSGVSITIGQGIFSRMFTSFNTPSSIKKIIMKSLECTDEFEEKTED